MPLSGSEKVHVVARNGMPVARSLDELAGTAAFDGLNIITEGRASAPITVAMLKAGSVPEGHSIPQAGRGLAIAAAVINDHFDPPNEGYTASAVHFDGGVLFNIASLTATDRNNLSGAFWFKSDFPATVDYFVSDPNGGYDVWGTMFDNGAGTKAIATQVQPASDRLTVTTPNLDLAGAWHFCIFSMEANHADPQPAKIYIDGVDHTDASGASPSALTFVLNGKELALFGDGFGDNITADIADFRLDTRPWLTAGDFTPTTLGYFRDAITGKPVDPSVATTALGAPLLLFGGNAAAFPTNQGTGGVFTVTGTLINASTSPSD